MRKVLLGIIVSLFLGGSVYAQPGNLGIGAIIGDPTGLHVKLWNQETRSWNFAAAWSAGANDMLVLQGDYVFYDYDLLDVDSNDGELPVYYGIGLHLRMSETQDSQLGVRVPLGINWVFAEAPLDIFFEIAPSVNLYPETEFEMHGGIGLHYFF